MDLGAMGKDSLLWALHHNQLKLNNRYDSVSTSIRLLIDFKRWYEFDRFISSPPESAESIVEGRQLYRLVVSSSYRVYRWNRIHLL